MTKRKNIVQAIEKYHSEWVKQMERIRNDRLTYQALTDKHAGEVG